MHMHIKQLKVKFIYNNIQFRTRPEY